MGRVVSPNDVFYSYEPWASHRPVSIERVQNPLMNDPPTAWLPLMIMMKRGAPAFHWDPYIGSGVPGFGSAGSAVLSPFILIPTFVVPLTWVYTAILLLKINVAFWFAYAWLREERLGKTAAALGAIVIAGAGVYATRWLWQSTNATALYPAMLWVVRRMFDGKRTSILVIALIALAYALSGFPSTMAYGAWLVVAYALFLALRERRLPLRRVGQAVFGVAVGVMIAMPFLVPFVQFIRRSGYLAMRESVSARFFPADHWRSFLDPHRLGHPVRKNWIGDPDLGLLNNFIEATIYVGALTIPLALLAVLHRRKRRWFWVAAAAFIVACIFGLPPVAGVVGSVPGFKYTALARVSLLLPVAAGYLAACGVGLAARIFRRRLRPVGSLLMLALTGVVAWDLGVFAGAFHPYLKPADAVVPATRTTDFLRSEPPPFRFAGFHTYLWPNGAQIYGIEDIASHFGSEGEYRRLVQRVDPTAWGGGSTVIVFNSLKFNFADPILSMLGVRYLIENRAIDVAKWTIFGATRPAVEETGAFLLAPGTVARRTIRIDEEPFWAIEIPAGVESSIGAAPRLDVELVKDGTVVWSRTFAASDVAAMNKLYVPLRPYARRGDVVEIRIWTNSMRATLLRAAAPAGESPLYYGRVTIPIIFERELPDGRVFRNLAEVPRFHAVRNVRKLNDEEFLQARDIDFSQEAVITEDAAFPPDVIATDGQVELVSYVPAEQRVVTTASQPMFLASSEKLTPELAVTVDGKRVTPVEINTVFAGVVVPAGRHEVVFSRRIGRGWWPVGFAGVFLLLATAGAEAMRALRRR